MEEVRLSNTNQLYTLLLLKSGPRHGYGIIDDIEEITGDRPTTSAIYPFLEELEDNSVVEKVEEGDRDKKVYSLTKDGRNLVDEQLESFGDILYAAIEDRVQQCSHCECRIYDHGYEQDGKVYCCEHCASADT